MVRLNLFSKKDKETKELEVKTTPAVVQEVKKENINSTEHIEPIVPEPPKFQTPPVVQYVEREITLSLLNDKINYLTTRFEEFLEAITKKEE